MWTLRFPARAKWEFNEIRRRRRKKRKRVVKFIMNQMQCEWMNEMEETRKKCTHFIYALGGGVACCLCMSSVYFLRKILNSKFSIPAKHMNKEIIF
jgi:hypothetical protein